MATKRELVVEVGRRYRVASSGEKRRILDEFVALTGYHRKHALRLLNGGETCYRRSGRPRSRIYDEAVHEALIIVWESADRICSKRLKALMPVLVGALERHGHLVLGAKLRELLLSISAATIDRLLAPQRAATSDRRRRRQSNGLVRSQIPVRTFSDWVDPRPGFMEADFVAHNGGNSEGSCVHTLVLTDIATSIASSFCRAAASRPRNYCRGCTKRSRCSSAGCWARTKARLATSIWTTTSASLCSGSTGAAHVAGENSSTALCSRQFAVDPTPYRSIVADWDAEAP